MRLAAEERLGDNPLFVSVAATAEDTTLPTASVEVVTAGQAFHWFDRAKARAEFLRILKPGGWVALIDNRHADEGSGLHGGVEALMAQYSLEHEEMLKRRAEVREAGDFFGQGGYTTRTCPNEQVLDLDGFKGRMTSRSTTPEPGQPGHEEVLRGLERLFAEYNEENRVVLVYETQVRFGRLD
jgi:SAM-dependent methyltransferase